MCADFVCFEEKSERSDTYYELQYSKTSSLRNWWFLASQPVSNRHPVTETPASQFLKLSMSACKV